MGRSSAAPLRVIRSSSRTDLKVSHYSISPKSTVPSRISASPSELRASKSDCATKSDDQAEDEAR